MIKIIEKAIAAISPQWACERAFYAENLRAYEAGEVNRFNDGWLPVNTDTENTDKTQRDLIKARARYLEDNSDIAGAAIGGIVRNVVGTGIKPQARTGNDELNKQIENLWQEWTRADNCDVTGQQTFEELQALLLRRKIVDGEILIKKTVSKKGKFPLKLQVIKSDLLSQYMITAPKTGNVIRSGVELDDHLKPLAYWIDKKSPDGFIQYDPDRIPAREIIHLWTRKQPDQIRGISDLAPIIKRLKDTQDYLDAETIAARIAACFSVFITTSTGTPGTVGRIGNNRDPEGKKLQSIRPGMIKYLAPGEEVQTANPSRGMANARDYISIQERLAGAGLGLSYELMSRDFNKASFSSARQGMLEDRKTFEPMQNYLAAHLCAPIYREWMDLCVMAGLLNIPDYAQNREKYQQCEWVTPGWAWIDPSKEVQADISALQNAGKTLSQWCAERGYDWREQLEQMALEKQTAESMGLKLAIHTPITVQAAQSNHVDNENDDDGGKENDNEAEEQE
ncbi:phage portal protein [Selenomonas ruminantium]|uniref:phage portal protein n=1 Tax=Selenomonas ruminantium TaxID=971 RepID=UPI0026EFD4CD|nr:phage portal protein [Selenomonas ruminantium]